MLAEQHTSINPSIFRMYDIRGIVDETLREQDVFLLGKAIGSLIQERGEKQIAVGRDGRVSGPVLVRALIQGILATGCNVIDVGRVPTPVLYYAAHVLEQHSGVMLTGSHNPSNYNGLKTVIQGAVLSEENIKNLYQRIINANFIIGNGVLTTLDLTERYINDICKNITLSRPLSVVVDAGSGVTGKIAPQLFRTLGCEVHELFCDIDGNFPHHHPDPSQPENLQDLIRAVKEKHADIGLAFDGDGDRLGVVTSKGEIIWSDRLLILFAQALLLEHPQAKIIFDVKCTNHLPTMIKKFGGDPIMWKTGHSLIKAKMAEISAHLAGEMSGHFFFRDRWYGFDDALYAGARLLEILAAQDLDSQELFASIPNSVNTPELKVAVEEDEKFTIMQQLIAHAEFAEDHELTTIDGLRVSFKEGWGLVRPSNTTPCLVLRFEAINEVILKEIQTIFRHWMLKVNPNFVLPF